MKKAKVLCGASVRQDQQVFDWYSKSLQRLRVPEGVELDFAFVDDSGGQTDFEAAWQEHDCFLLSADPRPQEAAYEVGQITHRWNVPTFHHLAAQKQKLLDFAHAEGYTHFFLVDSDLLLEPDTLANLLALDLPVVNGVFWTRWQPQHEPQPQCWLKHPYGLAGRGMTEKEFVSGLQDRKLVRVIGGGACTLIRTEVGQACPYSPILPGLPQGGMWEGEDRTFALRLQQHRIPQYACGWNDIYHAYHPAQRTPQALEEAFNVLGQDTGMPSSAYEHHVSVRLSPLEDPALAQSAPPEVQVVRGRLGHLKLLPELEAAVLCMEPGEERIVEVHFPPWYPLTRMLYPGGVVQYAGTHKAVRVELLATKAYSVAPVLCETVFKGLEYEEA